MIYVVATTFYKIIKISHPNLDFTRSHHLCGGVNYETDSYIRQHKPLCKENLSVKSKDKPTCLHLSMREVAPTTWHSPLSKVVAKKPAFTTVKGGGQNHFLPFFIFMFLFIFLCLSLFIFTNKGGFRRPEKSRKGRFPLDAFALLPSFSPLFCFFLSPFPPLFLSSSSSSLPPLLLLLPLFHTFLIVIPLPLFPTFSSLSSPFLYLSHSTTPPHPASPYPTPPHPAPQWVLIQNEGSVYELFLCVCLEIFDYCG